MSRERTRSRLYATLALAAGLLLRLWFVRHTPVVQGDTLIYGGIARSLLQHGIYGFTEVGGPAGTLTVRPTLIRLPGYPFFLAACFRLFGMERYTAVMYVQVAADLLTCGLASALAGRLFGRRAALAVLWLAALCPFTANYVAAPLTETLVLATIALAFYGLARWQDARLGYNRWLWTVAAALAWSILLRPDQGLLAAAILSAMLWGSLAGRTGGSSIWRASAPVAVAALCVLLPLVPWTLRNWHTFHVFQPLAPRYANDPGESAPLGFARWYRTWAIEFASTDEVYWNYNGDRIQARYLPPRATDAGSPAASQSLRDRTGALLDDYNAVTTATPEIDARFAALAAERIRAHPVQYYAGLPAARLLNMIFRPRAETLPIPDEWWKPPARPRQTALAVAYAAFNIAYLALAAMGLYRCLGLYRGSSCAWLASRGHVSRELVFAMAASLLLRSALLLTLDNSEPRYTLEFFPVLFVWIGALFADLPRAANSRPPVVPSES